MATVFLVAVISGSCRILKAGSPGWVESVEAPV
jgi:hypothetical protein